MGPIRLQLYFISVAAAKPVRQAATVQCRSVRSASLYMSSTESGSTATVGTTGWRDGEFWDWRGMRVRFAALNPGAKAAPLLLVHGTCTENALQCLTFQTVSLGLRWTHTASRSRIAGRPPPIKSCPLT